MKLFMELLKKEYCNHCCCISLSNFGEKVREEKYTVELSLTCSLIRKENGEKYIKTGEKLIEIKEELTEKEKAIINELIEAGVFDQLNLERWLEPKKDVGNTHFWRTGIADDDMQ